MHRRKGIFADEMCMEIRHGTWEDKLNTAPVQYYRGKIAYVCMNTITCSNDHNRCSHSSSHQSPTSSLALDRHHARPRRVVDHHERLEPLLQPTAQALPLPFPADVVQHGDAVPVVADPVDRRGGGVCLRLRLSQPAHAGYVRRRLRRRGRGQRGEG